MMQREQFAGKHVHIIGMARSGFAAAEVLIALGAEVTLHDSKDSSKLEDALTRAAEMGADVKYGIDAYVGIHEADIVVTSPGVPETCAGISGARNAGIPVIPEIELAYRISPAPILAITGTNGKTTTTALVGEMLRCDGRNVFVAGNIVAGDIRLPLVQAAYRASESDVIVAEISSFQLELISSFKPKVGALLNLTGDHMDRYTGIESYAQAKGRMFDYQENDDFAVVNADDEAVMAFVPQIRSKVLQFSSSHPVSIGTFSRGAEVWLSSEFGEQLVCDTSRMKLRGKHNVENILAAAAIVLAFGAGKECVQKAIERFAPPEHRMEPVSEISGVEFINNSMCTNVAAAVRCLEAVGRPAIVIAGGKDKGLDYKLLGDAFVKHAKHVVLIGQDAQLIESASRQAGFMSISRAASMEEAVEVAWQHSIAGDTVILSPCCASFDMFDDFEHRGRVFKSAVKSLAEREVRDIG